MRMRRLGAHGFRKAALDLDDVVYGLHAVEETLAAGERVRRLHIVEERKHDPALRALIERAREADVLLRFEPRSFFTQFPYKAHQGVVAVGESFAYAALDSVLVARVPRRRRLLVVLDHITDPHNLGAVIRTAECVGADAVVIPERRAAGVNATVRKSAAGAAAHIPIARVANIAGVLRAMKKAGIWVAGAALDAEATEYTKADFDRDLALVIGSEGEGISQVVRRECDYLVHVPLYGKIASLNASVAAAVLLYEVLRQRRLGAG
jgi:23S rRNA (guanosine2251-2'-O)-methyltransferase